MSTTFPFSISGSLTHLSALAISLFVVAFASGYAKQGAFELIFAVLGIVVLAVYLQMSWHYYKHGHEEQQPTQLPLEILKLISKGTNDKEKISKATGVEESIIYLQILTLAGEGYIVPATDLTQKLELTKKGYEAQSAEKKSTTTKSA
jgi:predicted transcriptional regulator